MALLLMSCSVPVRAPAPALEESFYNHDGVKIRFREVGKGRPVVFIHGFGASLDTWRDITDSLKVDHRLVLLDLKGHGFSDRPPDEKYSLKDHVDVVLGLVRHLGLKDVVLAGHSFGSIVAVVAALQASESRDLNITGLVVIDGALEPKYVPFFLNLLRVPVLGWLSVKLTTASFRTRLMLRRAFYDDSKITGDLVELYAKYQRIPGTEHAMIATARQMVPENFPLLKEKLAAFTIPVLNLWGEQDVIVKRPGAESVCKILPRCRLVAIPGSGHIPQEEAPAKVIPLFREFLDQVSRGASAERLPQSSSSVEPKN
ncbi:MAG: alpha/beta fold hydrolase [Alphaproteobacteria bacterium]